jgi:hypothetical protein
MADAKTVIPIVKAKQFLILPLTKKIVETLNLQGNELVVIEPTSDGFIAKIKKDESENENPNRL